MHPRIVRDAYQVLGIPTTASIDEIRQAYRDLALKWHPDRHIDNKEDATKVFFEVSHAYQALAGELEFSSVPTTSATSSMFAMLPTPQLSSESSTESVASITSSSRVFTMRSSNVSSSRTTPTSSLGGSVKIPPKSSAREVHPSWKRNIYQSPISVSVSSQATDGSGGSDVLITYGHAENVRSSAHNTFKLQTLPVDYGHLKQWQPTFFTAMPRAAPIVENDPSLRSGPPLQPLGVGMSQEWIYLLALTLEELFKGMHCRFCIVRHMNDGKTRNVLIELDIPPGCQQGTSILCRRVGHQLPDGSLQDVAFVIEQATHDRFTRFQDDLFLDLRISWTEDLKRHSKRVGIRGLDGEELSVYIDYARDKLLTGSYGIRGAGMPIRRQGEVCGRGNLIVRWELEFPQSKIRMFFNRFFHPTLRRAFGI